MLSPMKDGSNASPSESAQFRKDREEAVFNHALALPLAERTAFLAEACGSDKPLRERVEQLLRSHDQAGDFLERNVPPAGATPTVVVSFPISEKPGDTIGRYKIREKLGEGGCGVVYVAEQSEPVRRRVALKVIKLGMDTRSVIARFEAERQALAMMDHPNIAKVLDAGATATGRPYFVMELVRGIRITDYCDQNHLTTSQRLELFTQVCRAVQHAHQKGIIHRDLKPSNILVTLHDGVPVPKIIDFGISKATEGRLTDLTVYTELHQFIGTPAYMSPEQAEMSGLDIDTRSDIYSLGVLLYELLTGQTPFDAVALLQAGVDQMRRTIREHEPQRPSTRLSTMLNADLTNIAKRRGAEPPKLIHLIRGDLDWIVMKSLEKDRTRRYETAEGLSMDVQRYLNTEPVIARPPSSFYRFRKLVRRNKTLFAAGAAVATSLVLGLGVSIFLFIKENQAYKRAVLAEQREAGLRKQAEAGLALEKKMRQMGEIGNKLTTAGQFISEGQTDKAEALMTQIPSIPANAIIFNTLGLVYARQGKWQEALVKYAKSIEEDPTNYMAAHCLAPLFVQTGALEAYRQHCDRMLRQFAGVSDPEVAAQMAVDCLLATPLETNFAAINKLVDAAVSAGPTHGSWRFIVFAKGLAEYRQGHFADVAGWLQKVAGQDNNPRHAVMVDMVLAMAQYQLKQTDQARSTLARGVELANAKLSKLDTPDWNDQLTAHLLMREAQALIGTIPAANDTK
jgi:serine/threonine protein kinase/tetratricopeptide (TPR) repeat protein